MIDESIEALRYFSFSLVLHPRRDNKAIEALKKVRKVKQDQQKKAKSQGVSKAEDSVEVHARSENQCFHGVNAVVMRDELPLAKYLACLFSYMKRDTLSVLLRCRLGVRAVGKGHVMWPSSSAERWSRHSASAAPVAFHVRGEDMVSAAGEVIININSATSLHQYSILSTSRNARTLCTAVAQGVTVQSTADGGCRPARGRLRAAEDGTAPQLDDYCQDQ